MYMNSAGEVDCRDPCANGNYLRGNGIKPIF